MRVNQNISDNEPEIMNLVSDVIEKEKQQTGNPFLSERIMAELSKIETPSTISFSRRVLQLSAIAAGFSLVIFAGINLGKLYTSTVNNPPEVISINDAHIERIDLFISE